MTIAVTAHDAARASRLARIFRELLKGRPVKTVKDAQLLLEAIRAESSPTSCLESIVASDSALQAVRLSIRIDTSAQYIIDHVLPFIAYFATPEVRSIQGGQLLRQLVLAIVQPPAVWNAMMELYTNRTINDVHEETDLVTGLGTALAQRPLLESTGTRARELGYSIDKVLKLRQSPENASDEAEDSPGGRHDNDFADFRRISILPTRDELSSTSPPFLRLAAQVAQEKPSSRSRVHLDNQFRLLREDMNGELREDLMEVVDQQKGKAFRALGGLAPHGVYSGDDNRGRATALLVTCRIGLEFLRLQSEDQSRDFLQKNKHVIRHQGFGVLCREKEIFDFAFIVREIDLLVRKPPIVGLRFASTEQLTRAAMALATSKDLEFVMLDTAIFAYKPILEQLQRISALPLEREFLRLPNDDPAGHPTFEPSPIASTVARAWSVSNGEINECRIGQKLYEFDHSQSASLLSILRTPLSVIQGPPGTGKSFIGSIAARILLEDPSTRLLVLSYTNRAIDQFIQSLLDRGVSRDDMTRLGSKFSDATAGISFETQFRQASYDSRRMGRQSRARLSSLREVMKDLRNQIDGAFDRLVRPNVSPTEMLDFLEFSDQWQKFYSAFQVPETEEGFTVAGKGNKQLTPVHLYTYWMEGKTPEALLQLIPHYFRSVWRIPAKERHVHINTWTKAFREEQVEFVSRLLAQLDEAQEEVDAIFGEGKRLFFESKRVIACTTTGAAMYSSLLEAARPNVVLVEEAGEILEAHVLSALHPETKRLILIGDHKQLRPKISNYSLSVEYGDGYDLNMSLFERLIRQGHPCATLHSQRRMAPEISQLVREMTYPELEDDETTFDRPFIRGLQTRVAFVNHDRPELDAATSLRDRGDASAKASKQNEFEARLVLKLVRYLGQQGYKTDDIVVLTPYFGQLCMLRDVLSMEKDPVLNDLDSAELIRAGLSTAAAGNVGKGKIKLSTIDNYQGEESDIVVASLTRSNTRGDIGFMKAPERLNVLISRARNCLIMIGNMDTFVSSDQGKHVWAPFFNLLKEKGYLQDGIRVYCDKHPDKKIVLSTPEDFDLHCPDGGCSELCGTMLGCGMHVCQRRCHFITDHRKVPCDQLVEKTCDKQHRVTVPCKDQGNGCKQCHQEAEEAKRRIERDLELERMSRRRQMEYQRELQIIDDEIAHQRRLLRDQQEAEEQQRALRQHRADLANWRRKVEIREAIVNARNTAERWDAENQYNQYMRRPSRNSDDESGDLAGPDVIPGSARDEWEQAKRLQGQTSDALDALMDMIGLEGPKREFLSIKNRVDTALRQGVFLSSERLGCTLLGNPGTGKTTVARLYATFLTSMGLLPGHSFKETTGSRLASMGVSGCQQLIDGVLKENGGVIFIDEAYQLSSGNSCNGLAVLDFLLAEVENLTGKVVFVLAGYAKLMESFFAHNPGFPSRFPLEMKFADYTDDELLQIFERHVSKRFGGRMKVEGGRRGLYCRIVCRRLGRGRGKDGFGNARAVENTFSRICARQADRLRRQRHEGKKPDDLLLTKEDLIGPEPSSALLKSDAWTKLEELVGLESVKESVKVLVDTLQTNYHRELEERPIVEYTLNRLFLGNPGTGKTTVAKLYGQVLVDLGMLSSGEVIDKKPADFIGSALGESEKQTKGILTAAAGKVLVIDEAYALYNGGESRGEHGSDSFKKAVVDTLVSEVQSSPGDDRCVLLLGYKAQMEDMLQNANPGLARRFPLATAFVFDDFDDQQLRQILDMKLAEQGFQATGQAKKVVMEMLGRAKNRPNFGNAGEIDILLNEAKIRHQKRHPAHKAGSLNVTLEAIDFDENFDRADRSDTNVAKLFEGTIGCERVIATLQGYQETVRAMRQMDMDPRENVPFNFLFMGPPGTGKTSTARRMGKVFYDMGFLATAEVLECSATDLIGQYIGHTGPKVRQLLDKALGRVLLIDEAYRLCEGKFAREALDEIVDAITKERYHKKLIIILAAYEDCMRQLLRANPGMSSLFSETIDFYALSPEACFDLLTRLLLQKKKALNEKNKSLDLSCLEQASSEFKEQVVGLFAALSSEPNWANARDVGTLARSVFTTGIRAKGQGATGIVITENAVLGGMKKMLEARGHRGKQTGSIDPPMEDLPVAEAASPKPTLAPPMTTNTAPIAPRQGGVGLDVVSTDRVARDDEVSSNGSPPLTPSTSSSTRLGKRDDGVSDELWEQLQLDAQEEEDQQRHYQEMLQRKKQAREDDEMQKLVRQLIEEEDRRKHEAEVKERLEVMGLCFMGYHWIKQSHGYRCAGGSHFVSDQEVADLM